MQRLAKVVLQVFVPPLLKQHNPDPFGLVPIGQVPLMPGVVHMLPAVASEQLKCSALTSCQRLPPDILAVAEANKIFSETLACPPQLEPRKHDEKATPVAAAHETVVPSAPVRFSVF
jgi:hypothetical protein